MTPRFSFGPQPAPRDSEIVKKSSMLKVYLYREEDTGDLSGSFTLEGSFGNLSWQESQDGVDEGMAFVKELMRQFVKRPEQEGGCCG
jgi:hypothetical protein